MLRRKKFAEKTFANSHKIAKFTKVFSLESFPLYGNKARDWKWELQNKTVTHGMCTSVNYYKFYFLQYTQYLSHLCDLGDCCLDWLLLLPCLGLRDLDLFLWGERDHNLLLTEHDFDLCLLLLLCLRLQDLDLLVGDRDLNFLLGKRDFGLCLLLLLCFGLRDFDLFQGGDWDFDLLLTKRDFDLCLLLLLCLGLRDLDHLVGDWDFNFLLGECDFGLCLLLADCVPSEERFFGELEFYFCCSVWSGNYISS